MARKLEVEIVGDSRSLQRALGSASTSTSKFGNTLGKGLKVAGIAAAVGLGAVAVGLKKAVGAAAEAEVSQKRLQTQLRALGISYKDHADTIDDTLRKQSQLSAFDDEDLADSFSNLVRLTGDVNKALELNALAADVARGKGVDLAAAQAIVQKAQMGMVGSLRRQGIEIQAVTTAQDALGKGASESAKAQAKAADLIATKQAAVAQLQEKFAGQAKAYGESAAGAQERFGVAMENLGEVIGQKVLPHLVPLINGLTNFINRAAESERLREILGATFHAIGVAARALADAFRFVSEMAQRYWPQVKAAAEAVMVWYRTNLEPAIRNVVTAITVLWRRFGDDIVSILGKALGMLKTIVSMTLGNVASVVQAFLAILRGDWSTAWNEIKEIPRRVLSALVSLLRSYIGMMFTAAQAIGAAIVDGIKAGIEAAWSSLTSYISERVSGLIDIIKSPLKIFSPSQVTMEIGERLAEGLGVGFGMGMVTVSSKAVDSVNRAIDAMVNAVRNRQSALSAAFSELTNQALAAFDKLTSDFETKTERKIRLQDERRAEQDRQRALRDAQAGLDEAVAGGDPAAILEAERQLQEARFAIQRAADERRAAKEREAYENRRELQRQRFEQELAALENRLLRGEMTHEQSNKRLIALFKKYEIPFRNAAVQLGSALAEGLRQAGEEVGRQAQKVRNEIMKHLSNIQIRVNVDVVVPDKTDRRAAGGPVRAGSPYVVGEKGPELFVPRASGTIIPNHALNSRGAGMGGVTVHVHGNLLTTKREIEEMVRGALYDVSRRNPGALPGVA